MLDFIDFSDKGNIGGRFTLLLGVVTLIGYIFIIIVWLSEKKVFQSIYFKMFVYGIIFGMCLEIGKGIILGLGIYN